MSSTELEREAFIKQEICSVATDGIGIEPEDNYTQNNIVYCLTHKYLTSKEYWLSHTDDMAHRGIRIHKSHTRSCPRRNFDDLFTNVNKFNDSQARYIAKTVAYLIELITPAEKEVADTILARYVWQNNQYCFNYYTSVSHLEHFYVIDDYVKFPDKGLSAHMKIHFDAFRDGYHIHRNIHFYTYGEDLICSASMKGANFVIVDRNQDHRILACKILQSMLEPLLKRLDSSHEDFTPDNVKGFFDKISEFKQLTEMVTF
jgi:hypothetical protein